jgi:hypothetical protein
MAVERKSGRFPRVCTAVARRSCQPSPEKMHALGEAFTVGWPNALFSWDFIVQWRNGESGSSVMINVNRDGDSVAGLANALAAQRLIR